MDEQQQQHVAEGLAEGDLGAWRSLYDAYAERVWRCVARLMGSADSSEVADVVQETFLAAARSARRYDPTRGSLWMWLSGIARNHVAIHYRQTRRHNPLARTDGRTVRLLAGRLDGTRPSPSEALASAELAGLVRRTLGELPADYETLLRAKYSDEATVEEIAMAEDCSATAIRSKLARARRAFRRVFAKTAGDWIDPHMEGRNES